MKYPQCIDGLSRIRHWIRAGIRAAARQGCLVTALAVEVAFAAQEEGKAAGIPPEGGVAGASMAGAGVSDAGASAVEPVFSWSGYFQAIAWMIGLLFLLWGVLWLLRRSGRFNSIPIPGAFPRDGLRMEAQLSIAPKKGLVVVRYLNKRLLLGVTEHNIALLQESELEDDRSSLSEGKLQEQMQPESRRETKDLRHDAQLFAHLMRDTENTASNDKS